MSETKLTLLLTLMMFIMLFAMVPIGNMASGGYDGEYPGHCVNDEEFYYSDADHDRKTWYNYSLRNDANSSYNYFDNDIWYSKASRCGGDDWADVCVGQGKAWHSGDPYSYLGDQYESLRYVMQYCSYVPVDDHTGPDGHEYDTIENGQLNMSVKFKWYDKIYHYPYWPYPWIGGFPTVGLSCMMYFNCYVYNETSETSHWLWNYSNADYWGDPDMFLLEVFPFRSRYIMDYGWMSVPEGDMFYHAYIDWTTHDYDLHGIRLEGTAPSSDTWYEFENYDAGKELRDVSGPWIETWYHDDQGKDIEVLGFQLMAVALGNEVLCASVKMEVEYFKLNSYDDQGSFDNYAFKTNANTTDAGHYFRPNASYTDECLSGFIERYTDQTESNGDIVDNSLLDEKCPDLEVDMKDISYITARWSKDEGESGYTYLADIVPDRTIDMKDISRATRNYGQNCYYTYDGYVNINFTLDHNGLTYYAWICCYDVALSPSNLWDIPKGTTQMIFHVCNGVNDPARGTYGQFVQEHNYANDLQ